jgi:hypothetical protein
MAMKSISLSAALAATVIALGAALAVTPAPAQTPSGAPAAVQAPAERPSRIEGRIAFLKAELKITAAQEAGWAAVAEAMRENDRAMRAIMREARATRDRAPSAIERLELRQRMSAGFSESTGRFLAAFGPVYQSMSDDQKRVADELVGRFRHRGGHHGHERRP